jgi:hypothetical protein
LLNVTKRLFGLQNYLIEFSQSNYSALVSIEG